MIKNIIFDWSGTLSDNRKSFHQAVSAIFKRLGKPAPSWEEITSEFTLPYMTYYNKHFPDLTREEQNRIYNEEIRQNPHGVIYAGVKQFIEKSGSKGIRLFVLSSDPHFMLSSETKLSGLFPFFQEVVSDTHEKGPRMLQLLGQHALKPEETLYVGDTTGDVEAGKHAGVRTAAITWGIQSEEKLKISNPDHIINNISDLEPVVFSKSI
jgi:HAD superfamily hydrolase (TIGR01549 family)